MSTDPAGPSRLDLPGPRTQQEVPALLDRVSGFLMAGHCEAAARIQLLLVIEEAVVNVLLNGWPGGEPSERVFTLSLQCRRRGDQLEVGVEIIDNGVAFDPTSAAPPDLDASVEERAIGGLGIFLMHEMTDTLRYARVAGTNHLKLTKSCPLEGHQSEPG